MANQSINRFVSSFMKSDIKLIDSPNIKKIYNKDFDVLIYKMGTQKKQHAIVIDKRSNGQTIVYNNVDIASHHMTHAAEK